MPSVTHFGMHSCKRFPESWRTGKNCPRLSQRRNSISRFREPTQALIVRWVTWWIDRRRSRHENFRTLDRAVARRGIHLLIGSTGRDNNDVARWQTQDHSAVSRCAEESRMDRVAATAPRHACAVLVRRTIRLACPLRSRCSLRTRHDSFRFVARKRSRIAGFRSLITSWLPLTRRTLVRRFGWRFRLRLVSRGSNLCRRACVRWDRSG
jgi:hypothetical protein